MSTKLIFNSLDKHVCDLKWAQRLKEIGVRQDTFFHWLYDNKNDKWEVCWSNDLGDDEPHCAAFTAQDFTDIFPKMFCLTRSLQLWYLNTSKGDFILSDNEMKLSNVFARMLLSIAKNKESFKQITRK